ncbi:MAG: DUF1992 domain-containing protein [Proteobacteria bacterium]|nr:DUF1992 domain-containing protein [Pseudomonadota bacterium]
MLDGFHKIVEQRIQEALERGDFDDLPGRGRPLNLSDDARVPEELRLAYKILKNANCHPPELELKKEIIQIEDMLAGIQDEKEKYRQIKKLNFLVTKLNMIRPTRVEFEEQQRYFSKIVDRMSVSPDKAGGGRRDER